MLVEQVRERIQAVRTDLEAGALAKRVKKTVILSTVNSLQNIGLVDLFGQQVQERLPKITQVRWVSPEAERKSLDLIAQGFIPEEYTGHFVWLDANFMAESFAFLRATAEAHGLTGRLKRAIEPVARTVANGKQDRFLALMYPYLEAHAAFRDVTFFQITREKDTDVYDEQKQKGEADTFMEFLKVPGSAALLLPYGSIQAGRHIPGTEKGAIDGLKKLYDPRTGKPIDNLIKVFTVMEFKGRINGERPYFQPVTLRRSYRAQSPDNYLPTIQGVVSLYDEPSNLLRLFGFERLVVEVILGTPITRDDLRSDIGPDWKRRTEDTNKLLMERVAIHQLPEELGEFKYIPDNVFNKLP